MRFLSEVHPGTYVFLLPVNEKYWKWFQYRKGVTSPLGGGHYHLASLPDVIDDNYFLMVPTRPPRFEVLQGRVPDEIRNYVGEHTGALSCAQRAGVICARADHIITGTGSHSNIFIRSENANCQIGGQWRGLRQLSIASDGSLVIFVAAIDGVNRIFMSRMNGSCHASLLN